MASRSCPRDSGGAAGAMGVGEAVGYIISQFIGGAAGALLLRPVLGGAASGLGTPALAHNLALGATTLTVTLAAGFMIEAVLAFFPVTVVLDTAVAGRAISFRRAAAVAISSLTPPSGVARADQ